MEFLLDAELAKLALTRVFEAAPKKKSDGSLTGVLVETVGDSLVRFSINEGGIMARTEAPATIVSPGSVVVDLSSFFRAVSTLTPFDVVSGLGTSPLKIKKGSQSLTITYKTFYTSGSVNSKRVVKFLDSPVIGLEVLSNCEFMDLPLDTLFFGFRKVIFSATSETGTAFAGVLLKLSDSKIKIASMNGVCLTEFICSSELSKDVLCVLDSVAASKLYRTISKLKKETDDETISISISKKMFIFKHGFLIMGLSASTSTFPEYSQLLSVKRKNFVVPTTVLLENIRNIVFSSDREDDFRTTLSFHNGELAIRTPSCENDGIKLEDGSSGSLHIDFNIHLLEGCVRNIDAPNLVFSYKDRHSPVVISPLTVEGSSNLFSIIAPLK